jgi:hypothetical protein
VCSCFLSASLAFMDSGSELLGAKLTCSEVLISIPSQSRFVPYSTRVHAFVSVDMSSGVGANGHWALTWGAQYTCGLWCATQSLVPLLHPTRTPLRGSAPTHTESSRAPHRKVGPSRREKAHRSLMENPE